MGWKTYDVIMRSMEEYTVTVKARSENEAMYKAEQQCNDYFEPEAAFEKQPNNQHKEA